MNVPGSDSSALQTMYFGFGDWRGTPYDALGFDPGGLDALEARTGIATPALQARLLELELAGDVARLPGGLFQRRADA